jgi:murein DD-endopeptidase MepM/ murein hydrolase activator NlpD
MSNGNLFASLVANHRSAFFPVVKFDVATEHLLLMDFTASNKSITAAVLASTESFSAYVSQELATANAKFGIGGYDEHRTVYSRSKVFDSAEGIEPRRLHLGMDLWGSVDTPVFAVADGYVHSIANNEAYGDYGATIILAHRIGGLEFYSLYGHLSLKDLYRLEPGQPIQGGSLIAHFGPPEENGQWPPHLHFQLMLNMEGKEGDYPGVCRFSDRDIYLANCPNPDLLLQLLQYAKPPLSTKHSS